MSSKKVNPSNWVEMLGYSVAILIGIGWGASGLINLPKPQEQPTPVNTNSQY